MEILYLGAGTALLFTVQFVPFGKSAVLRRAVFSAWMLAAYGLILLAAHVSGFPRGFLYYAGVPLFALILVANVAAVRFCDLCGRMLWRASSQRRTGLCRKCGDKSTEAPNPRMEADAATPSADERRETE